MIADDFALWIAAKYVRPGVSVLDPFCGTARTLYAAADAGGVCFGIDVNPLAVLIARVKAIRSIPALPGRKLLNKNYCAVTYDLQPGRKVRWFTKAVERELCTIISWINSLSIDLDTRTALACALSATVREVSYCRKRQWKLHRMAARDRRAFRPSALAVFERRLNSLKDLLSKEPSIRRVTVVRGDARRLSAILGSWGLPITYDVIFTSPPYGDSRSTVGYGGISSICLGVLQHLHHLELPFKTGQEIDSGCLGGSRDPHLVCHIKKYWKGSAVAAEAVRITSFLSDVAICCRQIALASHVGTKAVFVISRRSVRRRRLYLDRFLEDELECHGFDLVSRSRRRIDRKQTPYVIDRKARSKDGSKIVTMHHEFVLVFDKMRDNSRITTICESVIPDR